MATVADLERAIDTMLGHPLGLRQYKLAHPVQGKVYEAYVFTLCLRAVRELGATHFLTGAQGLHLVHSYSEADQDKSIQPRGTTDVWFLT